MQGGEGGNDDLFAMGIFYVSEIDLAANMRSNTRSNTRSPAHAGGGMGGDFQLTNADTNGASAAATLARWGADLRYNGVGYKQ
jgi:hypothetical protein